MSINGPWDEDPMWVPDLEDSEFAMEVVPTCFKCQELEKELKVERQLVRHLHAVLSPHAWKCFPNCVYCSGDATNLSFRVSNS